MDMSPVFRMCQRIHEEMGARLWRAAISGWTLHHHRRLAAGSHAIKPPTAVSHHIPAVCAVGSFLLTSKLVSGLDYDQYLLCNVVYRRSPQSALPAGALCPSGIDCRVRSGVSQSLRHDRKGV